MKVTIPVLCALMAMSLTRAESTTVTLPGKSPLVNFRIVFATGAAQDPADKPGVASLTAAMLAEGGTRELTRKQILDRMFPLATSLRWTSDKEMTVFEGTTHTDNLDTYYGLLRSMLLDPGWREDDLKRLKDDAINYLRVTLRGNNDEELGKEVLYSELYKDHPYGRHNIGTVSSINRITIDDMKKFYASAYTQANLTIGLAGGYPPGFDGRVRKDFAKLPEGKTQKLKLPSPPAISENRMLIVKKPTRSVAYSFGFPIDVKRGHPDFPALLVAQSWFGQHRSSGGRLYERIRQIRGLNYGDYAYIEHFPNGMFLMEPEANIARQQQVFQVWIRPVEVPTAHFTLRLAMFELDRLLKDGLTDADFAEARNFVSKYVNLLTRTKSAELGYAIDSRFYGVPEFNSYVRGALAKLTRDDVNRAIRKHLRNDRMVIVSVAEDAEGLRDKLVANTPSPMSYNSAKPDDIVAEDKIVSEYRIPLKKESIRIVAGDTVFE